MRNLNLVASMPNSKNSDQLFEQLPLFTDIQLSHASAAPIVSELPHAAARAKLRLVIDNQKEYRRNESTDLAVRLADHASIEARLIRRVQFF